MLTFLDAHCEANVNWLEPLLDRIRRDYTTVAVPVIDIISSTDFSYSGTPAEVIGGFTWDMQFNWHGLPQNVRNQRKDLSEPVRLATLTFISFFSKRLHRENFYVFSNTKWISRGSYQVIFSKVKQCVICKFKRAFSNT